MSRRSGHPCWLPYETITRNRVCPARSKQQAGPTSDGRSSGMVGLVSDWSAPTDRSRRLSHRSPACGADAAAFRVPALDRQRSSDLGHCQVDCSVGAPMSLRGRSTQPDRMIRSPICPQRLTMMPLPRREARSLPSWSCCAWGLAPATIRQASELSGLELTTDLSAAVRRLQVTCHHLGDSLLRTHISLVDVAAALSAAPALA